MPKYKLPNGKIVTIEDVHVEAFLESKDSEGAELVQGPVATEQEVEIPGINFDDYLKPAKIQDSASADPTVESENTGSNLVDGSSGFKVSNQQALLNYKKRTGKEAGSIMDLSDEDYETPLDKFKPVDYNKVVVDGRKKIKNYADERVKLAKKLEIFSYDQFGATNEAIDYVKQGLKSFDEKVDNEVKNLELNDEFKLRNDALNQLIKDTGNIQATGEAVKDVGSEFNVLNVFRGASYYKDIEADEVISLNDEVEQNVLDKLDKRSLQKLASGFYTLQEKENLINESKSSIIDTRIKTYKDNLDKATFNVESKIDNNKKKLKELESFINPLQNREDLTQEETNSYNDAVSQYNNILAESKDVVKEYNEYKTIETQKVESLEGEVGFDVANGVLKNNFKLTDKVEKFREKYSGEGFWNGTADILGGEVLQGFYQTMKKATVGSVTWAMANSADLLTDQDSYSAYDAFSDVINNWSNKTLVPKSTSKEFDITKKEGGFKDFSARNYAKLGASMVPFTGYLISEVRKGKYNNIKQAIGDTYLKFGNKGKVLKDASQTLKNNIIMTDATFRATILDNQKEAEAKGFNGLKANSYATTVSATEAMVQMIMPDTQFLKGVKGKAILDNFTGSLKKAANKQAVISAGKEFTTNVLKEYGEEEINAFANMITDASYGLALPKTSDFLNEQIELTAGTLMLSGGMGSVGAAKTYSNQKKLVYDQIHKNINSLNTHLAEIAKKSKNIEVKDDVVKAMKFAKDVSQAIESSPKNVTSEQIDLLIKKKNLIDKKSKTDKSFHAAIDKSINEINEKIEAGSIRENVRNKFDADLKNISKSLNSSGTKVDETIVFEDSDGRTAGEKMKEKLLELGKSEKFAEANKNSYGAFIVDKNGKELLIVNKEAAVADSVVSTGQHEFLHKLLRSRFKNKPEELKKAANLLKEEVESINKKTGQGSDFISRLKTYEEDLAKGDLSESGYYEEVFTLFSEALSSKDVKINKSTIGKIGDFIRQSFQNAGFKKIKFNNADDVKNFILDYNKAFSKGKVKGSLAGETKSFAIGSSISFSKSVEDIKSEIIALEDQYDNEQIDYYAYENKLDILEAQLEEAKKAPAKPKIEPKKEEETKTKTVEKSVKKFEKEVSDEVVSDRNKKLAQVNEDIANEMLELGANRVSDIKDPVKQKEIIDKLGRNNLGAITNLTKKATAAGKDLAIDDNLKVGYDEFFSGFSEELSALIKSYKVEVDGKKVPFGAYMNKNLPLRYGQILDKALKGRIEGAKSLDVDSGEKGFAGTIAAEGSADFDAVSNADRGLPAGELIDVTTFRKVKDKVEDVKESIDLTDVDVDGLTYRKIQDDYSGNVGAEIIGLWDKNAKPKEGQDRNDFQKLAERIEGTRTLNYGKDTGGEAEVRAMQGLFLDYNDAVKFIKTIPEFNVAPFETTIDKQGRSIDLTEDARGYSTGISNKLLKKFYEPYIDPKATSKDKNIKKTAITSPSGRGKGKTSQVAKVYRLKPEYRGKISRQTVQELQKTIGITPAGEAFIPMKGPNRTEFGTALQGLTKMYATNVANTVIRKKIVDEGITSETKPTEKILADIGGGKSRVMFSKAINDFDPSFNVSFNKKFNKEMNDKFGFKSKYYELDPTSDKWPVQLATFLEDYEKFVKNTALGAFKPRHFLSSKNTLNPNIKKTDKNYELAYKRRKDARNTIRNINQKYKLKNISTISPPNIHGKKVISIEENIKSGKVLENNTKYSLLFDKTWMSIAEIIRKDRGMIPFIGHFLETSGETDHWVRLGAPLVAYDIKPKSVDFVYKDKQGNKRKTKVNFEYEHGYNVNLVVKRLFEAAADPSVDFEQVLKEVKKDYVLIALSAGDNYKLIKAKLATKMPKNWKTVWDRYFNELVASIDGGINIDNLMLIETIEEKPTTTPLREVLNVNNDGSTSSLSKNRLDAEFNKILENKTGILANDNISEVKAKMMADKKRKINFFIPPSAEDFVGLLYATLGKGEVGNKQMRFYDRTLIKPYARAMQAITRDRLDLGRAFKDIRKEFKATPKDLKKKVPNSLFTKEQAVRIYIWDSIGKEVPGLNVEEVNELANYVADNKQLKDFADQVMRLNPGSKYASPKDTWTTGTITTDLLETLNTSRRAKHLGRWQQNVDEIFSTENLNKLEAAYGTKYRKAMENMLTRMKTGRNRTYGTDTQTAKWIDWMNGSVGAIMFLNARSAVLQTISSANFINFGDNNVIAAGKAFANQKQYWTDFVKLINSDYLLERRDSLKINVNEADIAEAASKNGARGAINYLLKLGFTPTKFADSFAIASGGATFYRNRIKALIKGGMDPVAAEKAAMRDFIEKSEESQQSSRPDKISQEQAGPLGRVILAFANTPAQYARIIKKAASDLKNRRGSDKENISKILYYSVAQNLLFNALQQAIFAVAFGDEEEDEGLLDDKKLNIVNGMLDGIIRGTGIGGAVFSVVKNTALKIYKETEKKNPKYENMVFEAMKISPPISSKVSKIRSAGRTMSWDMKEIKAKGLDITSPAIGAGAQVISATTNIPLDRVVRKIENLSAASDSELETYKRLALTLGWGKWELGVKDKKWKDPNKKPKRKSRVKKRKVKVRKVIRR